MDSEIKSLRSQKRIAMKSARIIQLFLFLSLPLLLFGQTEKQSIRQGNKEFKKDQFVDSEISYRSALEKNPSSFKGNFNLGDAMYKQEKYEDATKIFEDISASSLSPKDKAKVYHNLGNAFFQQQKFGESVEAYKNALRNYPDDKETKYNLAQAQRMLVQQQQQQQQNNQGDSKDNKDENKQDQDQKQDQKENQDQQKQQNEQKDKDQQKQQQQQQEQQISPEDARRMLEALQNNEKDVQERVREQQVKAAKVRVEKNW